MITEKLGNLIELRNGFAFKSRQFNTAGHGLPIARIRDVKRGYSETFFDGGYDSRYLINDGDVLIGMDGEFNLSTWRGGPSLLNQRVCTVATNDERLDQTYLVRFLPSLLKKIEDATPFVTVKHLSAKQIRDIDIPLPPVEEQRRIAAILDKADALRAKRREAIAKLDQLLQSVFLEMFGDTATNPMNWPVKRLSEVCDREDRVNYGVVQPGGEVQDGRPLIRVGDFVGGSLDVSNVKKIESSIESKYKRSRLRGNELLVSCVGSIGEVVIVPREVIGWNIARAVTRVPISAPELRAFYKQNMLEQGVQNYFRKKTRTVSQPTLNVQFVKEVTVFDPPVEKIRRFCEISRQVELVQRRYAEALNEKVAMFASLQQRAFK